ncbi:MAG: hypothetical protein ISS19_00455 [Bacteroidales bacterium]|nr:hypothetical protein [Bacteroidales bacterium]
MNKKWLSLIILFICLSLMGIIVVQYLWIRNAMRIREAQFNQRVNDALGNAVTRLETNENMLLLSSRLISDSIRALIQSLASDSSSLAQSQIDSNLLHDALQGFTFRWEEERIPRASPKVRLRATDRALQQYEQFLSEHEVNQRYQVAIDSMMDQLQANIHMENDWVNIQFEWEARQLEKLDSVWVIQEQFIQRFSNDDQNLAKNICEMC